MTFPSGRRLFVRLKAAPAECLRSLRRSALCAPAVPTSGLNFWRKEDPSSVTAYAVTPSPQWGEGFECASWGRPHGIPLAFAYGRTSCARRSPTGRPYSARTGAIPSWGMPANSTHQRRQYKRGNRVSSTTRAGRGRHAQGPRLPYRGAGGKRTAGLRRNACGAVVPPGASPGGALPPGAK